eukprot:gene1372-1808_t
MCGENCHSILEPVGGEGAPLLCNLPCPLRLKCSHPCNGLCGEICPSICKVCMAGRVKAALSALSSRKLTKEEMDSSLFVMLNCKHSFEVSALDAHILKERSLNHYPRCPNKDCKATIQGVFRYSGIVRERIDTLRPPYYELREQALIGDFRKDLELKNFKPIVDRMRMKLQNTSRSTEETSRENPLLEFCLGMALVKTGMLKEASQRLTSALGPLSDVRLKAECADTLGLLYLKQTKNYGKDMELFEQALRCDATFDGPQRHLEDARNIARQEQERVEQVARASVARQQAETAARSKAPVIVDTSNAADNFAAQQL